MKTVNDILYIEWSELVLSGIPEGTLKSARARESGKWVFINDPDDNRKVLVEFEKLGASFKEKIESTFGNPYNYVARQPIKNMVQWDTKAEAFYLGYRYSESKTLPAETVKKYTTAASWLNMLKKITEDKTALKKLLNLSIDQFYVQVIELIKTEKIDLPESYRRLLATRKKYDEEGFSSLIDWRFGNKIAAKIKDELSESVLLEMIAHHNQYDDVFIAQQYNIWAQANSYSVITAATVGIHRRKNEHLIIGEREGNAALSRKYLKQAKGQRPTFPLAMVESDDNHLDLFFIDLDDVTGGKAYHRPKAIVVMDSYNDYVLGYAYGFELNKELVRAAYVNAMYHIRSLTGEWHLQHETIADRWALADLEPFYKNMGHFHPTPVGSKNRGYIEQFFGSVHWKRCMKIGANNYSGNNITASKRGVNAEVLAQNKKDRPTIGSESNAQIEQFFHRLRHMPDSKGTSKQAQWLQAWSETPAEKKRTITDEQFMLIFGIEHNHNGRTIQINNRGVEPQINGVQYSFNMAEYNLNHIGKSVTVIYDPYDMSRVLVTDFESVRMMAYEPQLTKRAIADAEVGSRIYLNSILKEKTDAVAMIGAKSDRRKEVIKPYILDAEAVLQAGIVTKELKQEAEQKALSEPVTKPEKKSSIYDKM